MQCTLPDTLPATPSCGSTPPPVRLVVSPSSLFAACSTVQDPRRLRSVRYGLASILALAAAAILSNHLSVLAIAEWGSRQHPELLRALGFGDGATPVQSTIQRLCAKLNPDALSTALERYFAARNHGEGGRGSQGVAIDGKAQRGRLAFDPRDGPVHALSAFLHEKGIVIAQEPIEGQGTEKAEAELTVAPQLLKRVDWRGRVLTGDPLFCQRNLCQQVLGATGDYLLMVKQNQPALYADIQLLFDPPTPSLPLDDRREANTVENGHGRHRDTRQLIASMDLVGYSDWPGLAQVFRFERTWNERGEAKQEVQYGITSLPPSIADADRLLELKRGHWQIENKLHYVKDVTLGEDRSLIHCGNGPSVMAMLRDASLSLLHQVGCRSIASRLRHHSCRPEEALRLVVG